MIEWRGGKNAFVDKLQMESPERLQAMAEIGWLRGENAFVDKLLTEPPELLEKLLNEALDSYNTARENAIEAVTHERLAFGYLQNVRTAYVQRLTTQMDKLKTGEDE